MIGESFVDCEVDSSLELDFYATEEVGNTSLECRMSLLIVKEVFMILVKLCWLIEKDLADHFDHFCFQYVLDMDHFYVSIFKGVTIVAVSRFSAKL